MLAGHVPAMTLTPSRALGAAAIGWLVVYNLMRFAGGAAAEVWLIALIIGGVLGLGGLLLLMLAAARSPQMARLLDPRPAPLPRPNELNEPQRSAVRMAALPIAGLAAASAAMAVVLGATYLSGQAEWSVTTLVLGGWNLFVAVWLADEYAQLRRDDADGLDAIGVGCVITAALAAVGFARDVSAIGQVALIVLAGIAGFAAGYASWRLSGRNRLPYGGILVGLAAVVALALAIGA